MTDMTPQERRGPIFIVGAVRSGTTLMRLILDSHDNIAIPQETGIMRTVQAQKFTPFWKRGADWYRQLGLAEDEFERELVDFYDRMFRRFAGSRGKKRWGEKTPWHVWHMEAMARMWPDASFVGVVRHPGGNVGSLQNSWRKGIRSAIRTWRDSNVQMVQQGIRLGDRFVLCRYEDLVLHTEQLLRELLAWLGEPWSQSVMRHHEVQPRQGAPFTVEGLTRPAEPIDAARVTQWTMQMNEADKALLRSQTADIARFFGYSVGDIDRLDVMSLPDAGWQRLVTGSQLGIRKEQFPSLDLETAPPVPLAEGPYDPMKVALRPRLRVRRPKERLGLQTSGASPVSPRAGVNQKRTVYRITKAAQRNLKAFVKRLMHSLNRDVEL